MSAGRSHPRVITCSRDPRNDLVAVECAALTGAEPDTWGVAQGSLRHVHQGAFLRAGVEVLAREASLAELARQVGALRLRARDFRIEWLAAGCGEGGRTEAVVTIANRIYGRPDLKNPRDRFLLLAGADDLSFGRIRVEPDRSYQRHKRKPFRTSTSLSARLARALVNLVAVDARTLTDPCCGTGSILLEAASVGLKVRGGDWNPRMVGMSRANVAHFGYDLNVDHRDARHWEEPADAIVTDLPFGRGLDASEDVARDIIARLLDVAPVAVYVVGDDISGWLGDAGYRDVETYRVPKSREFTRYIHRAWRDGPTAPVGTVAAASAACTAWLNGSIRSATHRVPARGSPGAAGSCRCRR